MFDRLRTFVLQVLRVPHDPDPPAGAPGSVRVFRASRNFYKLRLLRWSLGQLGALAGIVFSLGFLEQMERGVEAVRTELRQTSPAGPTSPALTPASPESAPPAAKARRSRANWKQRLGRATERWPMWVFPLLKLLEWIGVAGYLIQIPITYAMARLDYELRWYIVTDRSLRIRSGLLTMQEATMSFANIQQVVVSQGPLQRLLGLADLRVQSAGGGGGGEHEGNSGASAHSGVFHGVDNAPEIRDLVLARLRQFRETGLGDPDEPAVPLETAHLAPARGDALAAARELLGEARALRQSLV